MPPLLVGARVDALCVAYGFPVAPSVLARLERAKSKVRDEGGATMTIAGELFAVDRQARKGKPFALANPSGHLFVSSGEVVIDLAVPFLAAHPLADLVAYIGRLAAALLAPGERIGRAEVRELDLCADLAGVSFGEQDRPAFVARARALKSWRSDLSRTSHGTKLSGLHLGSRRELLLALYDKTAELATRADRTRLHLEHERWLAGGWNGTGPVWRAEFRARGRTLTEYGLRDPAVLADRIDSVWQTFTRQTVRLVLLDSASRRERCKTDPRWEALQSVSFVRADESPAERTSIRGNGAKMRQAVGTMISALAAEGRIGLPGAEAALVDFLVEVGHPDATADVPARLSAAWARIRDAGSLGERRS